MEDSFCQEIIIRYILRKLSYKQFLVETPNATIVIRIFAGSVLDQTFKTLIGLNPNTKWITLTNGIYKVVEL